MGKVPDCIDSPCSLYVQSITHDYRQLFFSFSLQITIFYWMQCWAMLALLDKILASNWVMLRLICLLFPKLIEKSSSFHWFIYKILHFHWMQCWAMLAFQASFPCNLNIIIISFKLSHVEDSFNYCFQSQIGKVPVCIDSPWVFTRFSSIFLHFYCK